ncbi:hypothetical protein Tco_1445117, partial [Tanacetum coccineum]
VSSSTGASGSKPRSNTKHDRILPAKSTNKKKVEDHPRTNKSVWTKVNRVDSSISSKRVVINSNSESVCKTCNKCLNSADHEMCVVNILNSVNATPTVKTVLNNGKQIWKPKGKKFTLEKHNCGYQWRPTGKKFALGELCPLTRLPVTCCSKLDLEEWMAPVRISSGPEPKKMLDHSSSSLGLQCQKTFDQISSNLVSRMSQRRFIFNRREIFLFLIILINKLHIFFHARSVVKWINVDQLIGKGNLLLDLQKLQKNPIFRISVDIRQNTNFVRAFTTSTNFPSIYIQLFWNTLTHDAKTGVYSSQVDEHWLTLNAGLLRKALDVTPADSTHPFESSPASKMGMYFVNELGHNIHKEKSFFKLVDEDEVQPAPEPHVDDDEYNLQ